MTQEEKAKAYDEAIDKIADAIGAGTIEQGFAEWLFPELKESDEKIRKEILDYIDKSTGCKRWVDWLEKQGEHKHTDMVKPKFHEGDWVILTAGELSTTLQIIKVDTNKRLYWFNDSSYLPIVDEECLHLWTIQDAKDGDVLVTGNTPFLYSKHEKDKYGIVCFSYGGIDNNRDEFIINPNPGNRWCDVKFVKPATKEQCDQLEKAMADAGYTFDFEKKELKEIVDKEQIKKNLQDNSFRRMFEKKELKEIELNPDDLIEESHQQQADNLIDMVTEKSTWNEYDEEFFNDTIAFLKIQKNALDHVEWIKSLKDRIQSQSKQEWSEEDEKRVNRISDFIWENRKGDTDEIYQQEQDVKWIKSLKERIGD